tara:strand:+ start:147 stop:269 length:123 start_codon:yes stop_codon:yes gene_type:complete
MKTKAYKQNMNQIFEEISQKMIGKFTKNKINYFLKKLFSC